MPSTVQGAPLPSPCIRGVCARISPLNARLGTPSLVDSPEIGGGHHRLVDASGKREWLAGRYINWYWDMPELEARKDDIVLGDKLKMRMAF